jgi:hypothetical protein
VFLALEYPRFHRIRTRGQERETAVNIVAREKGGAGENLWLCFGNHGHGELGTPQPKWRLSVLGKENG